MFIWVLIYQFEAEIKARSNEYQSVLRQLLLILNMICPVFTKKKNDNRVMMPRERVVLFHRTARITSVNNERRIK